MKIKTHDLANSLDVLARLLRAGPDVPLEDSRISSARADPVSSRTELTVGLSTLVSLSRIDKQQWISLIQDYGFPIDIRPRDASRDILGKLLSHLEKNADARRQLREATEKAQTKASPELMKALATLLKDGP